MGVHISILWDVFAVRYTLLGNILQRKKQLFSLARNVPYDKENMLIKSEKRCNDVAVNNSIGFFCRQNFVQCHMYYIRL